MICRILYRVVLATALTGCTAAPVSPATVPSPKSAISGASAAAADASEQLPRIAAAIGTHAAKIDAAAPPEVRPAIRPHTDAIRHQAGEVTEIGDALRAHVVAPLKTATAQSVEIERQLARAQAAAAAAEKRAAEAEHGKLMGWAVIAALGCVASILYVIFVKDIQGGIIGFVSSFVTFVVLSVLANYLHQIMLYGTIAGGVLVVAGGVWAWRSGLLTHTALNSAAKLLLEGKVSEAVAALRTDPDFARSWALAKAALTPAPAPGSPAAESGA